MKTPDYIRHSMLCPSCGGRDSCVVDSRPTVDARGTRRRRSCNACGWRWTTIEASIEDAPKVSLLPAIIAAEESLLATLEEIRSARRLLESIDYTQTAKADLWRAGHSRGTDDSEGAHV